jgi:hypothetical protein
LETLDQQSILESHIASGEDLGPERFPELSTLSPAFFYQFVPVAKSPETPEVVIVPAGKLNDRHVVTALADWNFLWEAAQYRKQAFEEWRFRADVPDFAKWVDSLPEANTYLVPDTPSKYGAYSPLFHLLPKRLLDRHGLPAIKRPLWPNNGALWWTEQLLPRDFAHRLSLAFAENVWKHIDSGSGLRAFDPAEPLKLLSHSLDFWLPYALIVLEERLRCFDRVKPETPKQRKILARVRADEDPEVAIDRPRMGGTLWMGEDEAAEVTAEIVDVADQNGRLRALIDAVKSNRVVDDFSPCWSFAREDFERKLYAKRSKVRVSFVELKDTLPVHSANSEYTDDLLWQDFTALLNEKERHVVVCLRSGTTKLGDIAMSLGYANHSPVSKALARIRKKAAQFLTVN